MNTYKRYASKDEYFKNYIEYQGKYRHKPRESDKLILNYVKDVIKNRSSRSKIKIADLGCSTGNLLYMLKIQHPEAELTGIDLSKVTIEKCWNDVELSEVTFKCDDILKIKFIKKIDIAILNAVTYVFEESEFQKLLVNTYENLGENGVLIVFDYFHPFQHQEVKIFETSKGHPEGMIYHQRSMKSVEKKLKSIGFKNQKFYPFKIKVDLELPKFDEEISSYTIKTKGNDNLCFRGTVFQPWCHMIAQK